MTDHAISRVLITGASGFIGKALCTTLDHQGFNVVRALRSALVDVPRHPGDIVTGDLDSSTPWEKVLGDIHAVVHLAAHVHQTDRSTEDQFYKINGSATEHLARHARAAGVKRFVFMSTAKVQGERTELNESFRETDTPAPEDAYSRSKLQAEQCLADIGAGGDMAVTILRPPLVYGPGVRANFLALLRLAATGWPLPLGAISNARSLIYIENLVSAVALVLSTPKCATGVHTYFLSDQRDLSTTDLIALMRAALNQPRRLFPMPRELLLWAGGLAGRAAQIRRLTESLRVDSRRITADLGWEPPVSMEEAIFNTCEWFRTSQSKASGHKA